jgi:hypothetical protein
MGKCTFTIAIVLIAFTSADIWPLSENSDAAPEIELASAHDEALAEISKMKDDSACRSLAEETIKSNLAQVAANQKILDNLQDTHCDKLGSAAVNLAQQALDTKKIDLKGSIKKLKDQKSAPVDFGAKSLSALKNAESKKKCDIFFGDAAYVAAQKGLAAAEKAVSNDRGAVDTAKKALADAKRAQKEEGDECRCRVLTQVRMAYSNMEKAYPALKKDYAKGKMMKCVLDGKKKASCSGEDFPKLKKPSGIDADACKKSFVHYVTQTPQQQGQKCQVGCGFGGNVLQGSTFCTEKLSKKKVDDAQCEHWKADKPKNPTKKCSATRPCAEWVSTQPAALGKKCNTKCGQKAHTLQGNVKCVEKVSRRGSNALCGHWGLSKPGTPTQSCSKTQPCVKWKSYTPRQAGKACNPSCGLPAKTIFGNVKCMRVSGGQVVADSECVNWRLAKPEQKSKFCAATKSCTRWTTRTPKQLHSTCNTKCDTGKHNLVGDAYCEIISNSQRTSDGKCSHLGSKPSKPKQTCEAARACVEFVKYPAKGTCPSACGTKKSKLKGKVQCVETKSRKAVGDNKCTKEGLKKPSTPVTSCKATPECVEWRVSAPTQSCDARCGRGGNTFTNQPRCYYLTGGYYLKHDTHCNAAGSPAGKKPAAVSKTCPATSACVKYKVKSPTGSCPTACGRGPSTLSASAVCVETVSGKTVSNSACSAQGVTYPASKVNDKSKSCAATASCYRWVKHSAPACPTKCGQPAGYSYGATSCHQTYGGKYEVNKSYCNGAVTPNKRYCSATNACPPACKVVLYKGYSHLCEHKTCSVPGIHWQVQYGKNGLNCGDYVTKITVSSGCRKVTAFDDDEEEEEELIQTTSTKSAQNIDFTPGTYNLDNDIEEDIKGFDMYAKPGACGL